jgi:hypothetical protein
VQDMERELCRLQRRLKCLQLTRSTDELSKPYRA